MDAQRWRQVRDLFEAVVDLPSAQWSARLMQLSPDDAALREEVLQLLQADAATARAVDLTAQAPLVMAELAQQLAEDASDDAAASRVGLRLGAFRLLREIGRGGMGTVWLAERVDGEFAQQVAIKLIRGGWDAAEVQARFRSERQILASLQHPHIAHLLDGGVSSDGKPWLALEYVDGVDLRRWCDEHRLDVRARLRVFLSVCDAVSYAHQRLVVHRDLKPSNILVGANGVVKLLDFGIAKLVDADAAAISATRIFTPEYAAPEQVRGEPVTTAVDIYALGLLLYELLTGRKPYHVNHSTPAAYERAILDQEPTRPSVIVTREAHDEHAATIAQRRCLAPLRLRRELRGDLDAIVLKALRKDPRQRYASVADFAADITRHSQHKPVRARRGNWRYRSGRFITRHLLALSLGAIAALAVIAGAGVALWQRDAARAQRDRAEAEATTARRVIEFVGEMFAEATPNRAQATPDTVSIQRVLDRAGQQIRAGLADQPQARAAIELLLANIHTRLNQRAQAQTLLQDARAITAQEFGADTPAYADVLDAEARVRMLADERALAKALVQQAHAIYQRQLAPDDPRTIRSIMQLGWSSDDPAEVLHYSQQAIALLRARPERDGKLETALNNAGLALADLQRYAEAQVLQREALTLLQQRERAPSTDLIQLQRNLAITLMRAGHFRAATPLLQESLTVAQTLLRPDHPLLSDQQFSLSSCLLMQDQIAAALPLARAALAQREADLSASARRLLEARVHLADVLFASGDSTGAAAQYELTLAHADPAATHGRFAQAQRGQAELALMRGDLAAAQQWASLAEAKRRELSGTQPSWQHAEALGLLGYVRWRRGERAAGAQQLRQAEVEMTAASSEPTRPQQLLARRLREVGEP